jgi:hypothetical protein
MQRIDNDRRLTHGVSSSFFRTDLISDPLENRERFAVKLRVTKRKELLSEKRLKLTKSRPSVNSLSMTELKFSLLRQSAPVKLEENKAAAAEQHGSDVA